LLVPALVQIRVSALVRALLLVRALSLVQALLLVQLLMPVQLLTPMLVPALLPADSATAVQATGSVTTPTRVTSAGVTSAGVTSAGVTSASTRYPRPPAVPLPRRYRPLPPGKAADRSMGSSWALFSKLLTTSGDMKCRDRI